MAHPPGYPLIIWIYWFISWDVFQPLGSPAIRFNATSAVFGAGAAWLVARTAALAASNMHFDGESDHATADGLVGAVAGTMWGLAPLVWAYHIGAEVFALNNILVAAVICLTSEILVICAEPDWRDQKRRSVDTCVAAGALLSGLALANQHTSLLFLIVLVPCVFFVARVWDSPSRTASTAAFAMLGLVPYAWLPVAHTWYRKQGSWGDCSTIAGFWRHISRADYGTFQLYSGNAASSESAFQRTMAFFIELASRQLADLQHAQFTALSAFLSPNTGTFDLTMPAMAGIGLAAIVLVATFVAVREEATRTASVLTTVSGVLALSATAYLGIFHSLSNMPLADPLLYGVHARFWMQPMMPVCILISAGTVAFVRSKPISAGISVVALAILVGVASSNFAKMDQTSNTIVAEYARHLLEQLPINATVVTAYDFQWTGARYMSACERVRPDVTVLNAPMLSFDWLPAQAELYSSVTFPGTHLVKHMTAPHRDGGFSWLDFVDSNVRRDTPAIFQARLRRRYGSHQFVLRTINGRKHRRLSPLVIAGEPMYHSDLEQALSNGVATSIPAGLGTLVLPPTNLTCAEINAASTSLVGTVQRLKLDPSNPLRHPDTWERAVWLEAWMRLERSTTHVLDEAVGSSCLDSLVTTAWLFRLLETKHEVLGSVPSAAFWKNAGLAHTHLVRSKGSVSTKVPLPLFATSLEEARSLSAPEVVRLWKMFVRHGDSQSDPSYEAIVGVLRRLQPT